MTRYLTIEQVVLMQREVVSETGGEQGILNRGLVESAVAQPQATFGGIDLYPSLSDKIAARGFSLIWNHAFADGNKRIGHVAMRAMAQINGHDLAVPSDEQERVILSVAAGEMEREEFTTWVRNHVHKL